ncbi:BRO family protein [Diplocloster agilis]|uniref:BRO family protein n=1 Tax=Diplocloster agilis TaxID=2850323 RepID=UPI001EE99935
MSRTQMGYALKYKQPQNAITIIHKRYPDLLKGKSIEVAACQFDTPPKYQAKETKIYMYNERGIYDIVRKSNQPVADEYFNWVYDVIQSIKQNGYYIASDKDDKWLGVRQETKEVRRMETDQIQKFVAYSRIQGSQHADTYYTNLTKLVNKKLGIASGQRDNLSQQTLMELKGLETIVQMHLKTLMDRGIPYKDIYQGIKRLIDSL